ncbi:uncharacterized protein LOC136075925 [Hydra vulgaris]|uniref:Uncharacterized protein LOC136075925 n=1 Tax=Hydra vulgaris TaxID=6087 RepID=A0ABM4B980_HYDVU
MTIDIASKKIAGLIASIQNLQDRGIHNSMKKTETISKDLDIEASFPIKRKRKAKRIFDDETREESSHMPSEKDFEFNCNIVFDSIITQLNWRFETMAEISSDFEFLNGNSLASMSVEDLKKCGDKLYQKYVRDLNANEFPSEIESFKFQASVLIPDLKNANPLKILQFMHTYSLTEAYPFIEIALRIFLTLPVTVASCERGFSKLKLLKNYLRSFMGQEL